MRTVRLTSKKIAKIVSRLEEIIDAENDSDGSENEQ